MHRWDGIIQMNVLETGCQWGVYQYHNSQDTGPLNTTTNNEAL